DFSYIDDVLYSLLSFPYTTLFRSKLDLSHVEHVSREIGTALKQKTSFHTVVLRSTVLPGTTETLMIPAIENASGKKAGADFAVRSEEHTSELQSRENLVCRLLLEK